MAIGRSRTRSGFTLVEAVVVIGIVSILLALLLPAIQRVRAAADRLGCHANLRQLGLGLTQYAMDRGSYPSALQTWGASQAFLSWEGRLLPYLGEGALWNETLTAYQTQPLFWVGPHLPIRSRVIPYFVCPADSERTGVFDTGQPSAAYTHYLAVSGHQTGQYTGVMYPNSRVKKGDIPDGFSNTVLVGERPASANGRFGWWYAGIGQLWEGSLDSHMAARQHNQTFYAPMCPLGPYPFQRGSVDDMCSTFHFWSLHPGGAHFLFADGSARFLAYTADSVLPALATRAGKEPPVVLD